MFKLFLKLRNSCVGRLLVNISANGARMEHLKRKYVNGNMFLNKM